MRFPNKFIIIDGQFGNLRSVNEKLDPVALDVINYAFVIKHKQVMQWTAINGHGMVQIILQI